jgi:hypothetical protein
MEIFQFLLILLVTYFGMLIGTIISRFTREEINPGKKYFLSVKSFILTFIFSYFFYQLNINIFVILVTSITFFIIVHSLNRKYKSVYTNLIEFSLMSIMFNETLKFGYIVSILCFFYLIVFASLEYDIKFNFVNNLKISFVKTFYFPIFLIILYFI